MTTSRRRMVVAIGLGALVVIAGTVAVSLALGAPPTNQTRLASNTTPSRVTLIEAGTTQVLISRGGIPVCYDAPFNVTGSGTLSGGLSATGLVNWYILSPSGGAPLTGTITSGTMSQVLFSGQYVLEFCNQQTSSLNFTVVESFVITQD
jgi:hypothetical protein